MDAQNLILEKLDDLKNELTEIKVQTTKTNGRVTGTERRLGLIERIGGWAMAAVASGLFVIIWEVFKSKIK